MMGQVSTRRDFLLFAATEAKIRARSGNPRSREAFRMWFCWLAECVFFLKALPAEIRNCSSLLQFAWREALRSHTRQWARRTPDSGRPGIERSYYRLRARASGGRITYELEPWSGAARRGDLVAVRVSVRGTARLNAFLVEDPLPAGAEAITRDRVFPLEGAALWWNWWLNGREMRDERVTWLPWTIPGDGFEAVYLFRFTNAGRFRAAPARVDPMYEPGVKAWSGEAVWEVSP